MLSASPALHQALPNICLTQINAQLRLTVIKCVEDSYTIIK